MFKQSSLKMTSVIIAAAAPHSSWSYWSAGWLSWLVDWLVGIIFPVAGRNRSFGHVARHLPHEIGTPHVWRAHRFGVDLSSGVGFVSDAITDDHVALEQNVVAQGADYDDDVFRKGRGRR
jgi:hypothetical protein